MIILRTADLLGWRPAATKTSTAAAPTTLDLGSSALGAFPDRASASKASRLGGPSVFFWLSKRPFVIFRAWSRPRWPCTNRVTSEARIFWAPLGPRWSSWSGLILSRMRSTSGISKKVSIMRNLTTSESGVLSRCWYMW